MSNIDAPQDDRPQSHTTSLAGDEARELAIEELQSVLKRLKEAKKVLARDWAQMTPRERSAHSKVVKEIEQQKQSLLDTIEMSRAG